MEVSKIHLSSAEMELMQNAEIILTKNRVMEKMKCLLEDVQHRQVNFSDNLTSEYFNIHPKISRGENYLGLPYLILDYPRIASAANFFFIRTMFWWGNFFSCTLHLSGSTKLLFKDKIKEAYPQLRDYFISSNGDPWVHRLEAPAYGRIDVMSKEAFYSQSEQFDHIKIAGKHPLSEWETAADELYGKWKLFLSICGLVP